MRFFAFCCLCIFAYGMDATNQIPSSLKGMTIVDMPTEGGNQAVFILQDLKNKKYILKILPPERLKEEVLAGRLYQALGVNVPANRSFYVEDADQLPQTNNQYLQTLKAKFEELKKTNPKVLISLSEFIEGKKLCEVLKIDKLTITRNLSELTEYQQTILKQIQCGFIADCLLGNWDITIGFKNMMVGDDGKVYRFDNGGSLRYRAMGERKSQADLDTVKEIDSLLDSKVNPDGAVLFKFVTDQDIKDQINLVLGKKEELFKAYDDLKEELAEDEEADNSKDERELKSLLIKRLDSLAAYSLGVLFPRSIDANPRYTATDSDGVATVNTSAGMLNITKRNGEFFVLLGKRTGHNYWGNFGGKSDPGEQTLLETAIREVREESSGMINIAPQDLRKYPSHDLVSRMHESDLRPEYAHNNTVKLFRMYLVEGNYIEPSKLIDKEYTEFMWVNLKNLMSNVSQAGLEKGIEGEVRGNSIKLKGIATPEGDKKDFELHWPLYCMLRQEPVINHIQDICKELKPQSMWIPFVGREKAHIEKRNLGAYQVPHTVGSIHLSNKVEKKATVSAHVFNAQHEHWPTSPYLADDQLAAQVVNKGGVIAELKNDKRPQKRLKPIEDGVITKEKINDTELRAIEVTRFNKEHQKPIIKFNLPKTTATEAMLGLFLKEDTKVDKESLGKLLGNKHFNSTLILPTSLDYDDFIEILLKVHKTEQENQNKFVFYHGCNTDVGFFWDVLKEFRNQLAQQSGGDIRLLRAFDDQFGAKNMFEMLLEEGKHQNIKDFSSISNYGGQFANKNLPTNVSLVGSPNHGSSSSYYLFYQGTSVSAPNNMWLIKNLIDAVGSPRSFDKYMQIYENYIKKQGVTNGRLLQIFIDPSVVDDLCCLSLQMGRMPFSSNADELKDNLNNFKPSELLKLLREKPKDFLTKWTHDLNDLQARLYLKPELFWDTNKVMIKSYWRQAVDEVAYQETIKQQVQSDIAYWLKSRVALEEGAISQGVSIQHGYKLAYEGIHGVKSYALKESTSRLHGIIEKDDIDTFKAFSQKPNFDINMQLTTQNKNVSSILAIAINSNALKITEYLFKTLIKNDTIRTTALDDVKANDEKESRAQAWVNASTILNDIKPEYLAKALEDVKVASNDEKEKVAQAWNTIHKELAGINDTKERVEYIRDYDALQILKPIYNEETLKAATADVKAASIFNKKNVAQAWVNVSDVLKTLDTKYLAKALEDVKAEYFFEKEKVAQAWMAIPDDLVKIESAKDRKSGIFNFHALQILKQIDNKAIREAATAEVEDEIYYSKQKVAQAWVKISDVLKTLDTKYLAKALEDVKAVYSFEREKVVQAWMAIHYDLVKIESSKDRKSGILNFHALQILNQIDNKEIRDAATAEVEAELGDSKQKVAEEWVKVSDILKNLDPKYFANALKDVKKAPPKDGVKNRMAQAWVEVSDIFKNLNPKYLTAALEDVEAEPLSYSKQKIAGEWVKVSKILEPLNQTYLAKALEDVKAASRNEKEKVAKTWIVIPDELDAANDRANVIGYFHALQIIKQIDHQEIRKAATADVETASSYSKEYMAETWVKVSKILEPLNQVYLAKALEDVQAAPSYEKEKVAQAWITIHKELAGINDTKARAEYIRDYYVLQILKPIVNETIFAVAEEDVKSASSYNKESVAQAWVKVSDVLKPLDQTYLAKALEDVKATSSSDDKERLAKTWIKLSRILKDIKPEHLAKALEDVKAAPSYKKEKVAQTWITNHIKLEVINDTKARVESIMNY